MNLFCRHIINVTFLIVFLGTLSTSNVWAGFLEMPDTTEVPDFERESMLLDLDIPPVRDRDPDPEAGPRLNVKEFRLQGIVEYPKLGITRAAIIKKIEEIRFELMAEGTKTDSGYTLDELSEVSDLVADIEKETDGKHVGPLEVQKLVFLIRDQRRRRGVTLGMIETVADTITRYYRERGFILAKAYIPQQNVRDGVVTLTLLLGELGEVSVENNKRVSDRLVTNLFSDNMHKPITSTKTEEALYLINDIPGVSAQGYFQAGDQVGDTRLTVNVTEERWYSGHLRLDNHGSKSTGAYRLYADVLLHNPLGIGDELQLSVLNSFSPQNTVYGSLYYSSNLFSPRWKISGGFSNNAFVIGDNETTSTADTTGESTVADLSLGYIFKRSRVKNYRGELKVSSVDTVFSFQGTEDEPQQVGNLSLDFYFDVLSEERKILSIGRVSLIYTDGAKELGTEGVDEGQDITIPGFLLSFDYSRLSFVKLPFSDSSSRLVLRASGQVSSERQESVNLFGVAGPTLARGYDSTVGQFDNGLYLGADFSFNSPNFGGAALFGEKLSSIFQPMVLMDVSYGYSYKVDETEGAQDGYVSNIGFGFKLNHSKFSSLFTYSIPLSEKLVAQDDVSYGNKLYFELQYNY